MADAPAHAQSQDRAPPTVETAADPILNLKFLSHGTLESKDLEAARAFYTDFLGLHVVRTSNISLLIRLGGPNTIAVVEVSKKTEMPFLNHNGLDVTSEAEVDEAYEKVVEHAETYGLHKITRPRNQHGTYSFYFWDADDNAWEILTNPDGGYSWLFDRGDQEGKGHLASDFERPKETRS